MGLFNLENITTNTLANNDSHQGSDDKFIIHASNEEKQIIDNIKGHVIKYSNQANGTGLIYPVDREILYNLINTELINVFTLKEQGITNQKLDNLSTQNQELENKFDILIEQNKKLNDKFDQLIEILKNK